MTKRKRSGQPDGTTATALAAATTGELVSYGILLYKRGSDKNCEKRTTTNGRDIDDNDKNQTQQQQRLQPVEKQNDGDDVRFLLGLIPQRNWWTIFKGLPNTNEDGVVVESSQETALREFQEETSIVWPGGTVLIPELTLQGSVGSGKNKKKLVIFLVQAVTSISTDQFDVSKVIQIDKGYMKGQPEIVAIQWLSYRQATNGIATTDTNNKLAKIYTSQRGILEEAHQYLTTTGIKT
jgi:8-oxo-dGTP pyrophosphatase MutT (NUDIX family)